MKRQRYAAFLLLLLSLVMLGVPVVPHHHHPDGRLCMKNDIGGTSCPSAGETAGEEQKHCCCQTGCITTHFFQERTDINKDWLHPAPDHLPDFLPAIAPPTPDLSAPIEAHHPTCYYIETLHGISPANAPGLRAPPTASPLS